MAPPPRHTASAVRYGRPRPILCRCFALAFSVLVPAAGIAIALPASAAPQVRRAATKAWPAQPLRGLNTTLTPDNASGCLDEAFFLKLRKWNVNLVRFFINIDRKSPWDVKTGETVPPIPADDPMLPYRKNLQNLDRVLGLAARFHIFVIPCMGDVVGRTNDVMLKNKDNTSFYAGISPIWRHIARKHGANPWLLAYDLLNEPNGENAKLWTDDISRQVIRDIRAIDKETCIVYEPAPWALPDQAFDTLKPLDDPKIVYSFHFYYPQPYTHQGIYEFTTPEYSGKPYPGELKFWPNSPQPNYWDKAQLQRTMANAIRFQDTYKVRIWVGEFSVIRWAPGGEFWLRDVLDIFESHGWDWCFHCYGDWNGWDPTYAAEDPQTCKIDGGKMTDRIGLLQQAWSKNRRF